MNRFTFFVILLCSVSWSIGCSEKLPYDVAPVQGLVTVDGQPLTNTVDKKYKVMFAPIAESGNSKAGKPGVGLLSDDGTYILSTYDDEDGAVVGQHWVTVVSTTPPTGDTPDTYQPAKFDRLRLPKPRTVKPDEENVINFELTSDQLSL